MASWLCHQLVFLIGCYIVPEWLFPFVDNLWNNVMWQPRHLIPLWWFLIIFFVGWSAHFILPRLVKFPWLLGMYLFYVSSFVFKPSKIISMVLFFLIYVIRWFISFLSMLIFLLHLVLPLFRLFDMIITSFNFSYGFFQSFWFHKFYFILVNRG